MPDLQDICAHIARGSNLIDYCEENDLDFAEIEKWLNEAPERIGAFQESVNKRKFYHVESMLKQLAAIIECDVSKAYDSQTGDPLPINEWPKGLQQSLATLNEEKKFLGKSGFFRRVTFKTWDKMKAMELMGKYLDMLNDNKDRNINVNVAFELNKARERLIGSHKKHAAIDAGTPAFSKAVPGVDGSQGTPSSKNIKFFPVVDKSETIGKEVIDGGG